MKLTSWMISTLTQVIPDLTNHSDASMTQLREIEKQLLVLNRQNRDERINLPELGSRCVPLPASPEDKELFLQDLTMR